MSDKLIDSQQSEATVVPESKDLQTRINEALDNVDDSGKVIFDKNVDPLFKAAVVAAGDARFYQRDYTKSKQELAKLKATNSVLAEQVSSSTRLTAEQTEELDELKFTNPDEWFSKKQKYENEARLNSAGKLKDLTEEAQTEALRDLTLSERKEALASFQTQTGIVLTDDIMQNDIPPRLQAQINDMPFGDYLNKVAAYLGKDKVVKPTDSGLDQPNIGNLAGGAPTGSASKSKYQIL